MTTECPKLGRAVAVQENHDLPQRLLLSPGGENACGPHRPNAIDFAQPVRGRLDNVKDLLAKGSH
jgi:hypothetical protein